MPFEALAIIRTRVSLLFLYKLSAQESDKLFLALLHIRVLVDPFAGTVRVFHVVVSGNQVENSN